MSGKVKPGKDEKSIDQAKRDFEEDVERIFSRFEKRIKHPLAEAAKRALRDRYGVYSGYEESKLDLENALDAALAVNKAIGAKLAVEPAERKTKTVSRKCFERRLHMVEFVEDSLRKSGSQRPDWSRIVEEWNAVHPYDRTNADALRVEYNRALREWDVVFQYLLVRKDDRPLREYMKRTNPQVVTFESGPNLKKALAWFDEAVKRQKGAK